MDNQTVTIKLKPYLQEFLRCKLQADHELTVKRNFVGTILKPFLQIRPGDVAPVFPSGPEYITFQLPTYSDLEVRRGTVYVSDKNQAAFERILNAYFWDFFFTYMDDKVRYLGKERESAYGVIKRCILQFCSDFNISFNDLNYDMMKKAYYRRRVSAEKKQQKPAKSLSLTCLAFLVI